MAIWPSCQGRALGQPELPEPAIFLSSDSSCSLSFFLSPGGSLLSSSGFFSKAETSLAPRSVCCKLFLLGLVGAPSLSLGVVCLPGNSVLSYVGARDDGRRNVDIKLEALRHFCTLLPTH